MRILLVSPRSEFPDVTPGWLQAPQLSLVMLAALTPAVHTVRIVEEEREPVPLQEPWDLVGISVMTATAHRAYRLAADFRRRGAKVVLGGIHVSLLPGEAAAHADTVVIGEAEPLWSRILEDASGDRLRPRYECRPSDLAAVPLVRYPVLRRLWPPAVTPVVATRGCPQNCDFCCVHQVYGRRLRRLPVERVVAQVRHTRSRLVAFLDDNLVADREWALALFKGLGELGRKLIVQVPVSFILDRRLFDSAVAAGLKGIFTGFEAIDPEALAGLRKPYHRRDYVQAVRRCRRAGVLLQASFIFGLDPHDHTVFDRTLDFILQAAVPSVSACVLTPYPGTVLYHRMRRQRRLIHRNWAYYDHVTPVFQPARMSLKTLARGYMDFREALFGWRGIAARFKDQLGGNPAAFLGLNLAFRHTTANLRKHYQRYFRWLKQAGYDRS